MKLYNTLNKSVEDIRPLNPPAVTVYTCGPTVYDFPHIGNWFTFIRYDLLVRSLRLAGYETKWVMNITDVGHLVSDADEGEDKLEKGARREGTTAWEVAAHYTENFLQGLERLNFIRPDYLPKATDHIEEQIALVKTLEDKGFTYVIDDGVYYDTAKFPHYADFAQLDVDEQQAGKRVELNRQKRNPTDFALWKFSPKGQQRDMEWDSPWGLGFPGWHLECSAMSIKYLGETIDIHSGGIDHIPVHHTNEIAQSEAANGQRFSNYWMHTNHITVEGEKISKSLGNGITLEDIEAKGYEPEVLRLHVLESHYRSQSKFSWDSLDAARNRLQNYRAFADILWQLPTNSSIESDILSDAINSISEALLNDIDTPKVLALLSEVESQWQTVLSDADRPQLNHFLQFIDNALGLMLSQRSDIEDRQKDLIKQRDEARSAGDWSKSDELRDELKQQNISLRDTPDGAVWFRI